MQCSKDLEHKSGSLQNLPALEMETVAKTTRNELLHMKSKKRYDEVYEKFSTWQKQMKTDAISESILLAYFKTLSEKYQPNTLWSQYSMLKSKISSQKNVDIGKFINLTEFLKNQSKGFQSARGKVLEVPEIERFLNEAPNDRWLAAKVILIIGITGGCRGSDFINMKFSDIENNGSTVVVRIPDTKTYIPRSFVIEGKFAEIVRKYINLRPIDVETDRFFLNYQNGRCTKQVIGIHKITKTSRDVAEYLELPDANLYTGHCLRRTSATLLGNQGVSTRMVLRHGPGTFQKKLRMSEPDLCRTCLTPNDSMISFENSIVEHAGLKIVEFLKNVNVITIPDNENVPKKICNACFQKLQASYEFHLQCLQSEEYWKTQLTKETKSSLKSFESIIETQDCTSTVDNQAVGPSNLIPEFEIKVETEFIDIEDFQIKQEIEDHSES